VAGEEQPAPDQILDSGKRPDQVSRVSHIGNLCPQPIEHLGKGTASQRKGASGEPDIQKHRALLKLHHRAHSAADIRNFGNARNQHRARSQHLLPVGVFLGHGQRILPRGNVDAQGNTKIAGGLHGLVQTGILTLVLARPHPVGAQRDALDPSLQGRPDQIGQRLGDGQPGAGPRMNQRGCGRVPDGRGYATAALIVQSHDGHIVERKLNLPGRLLQSHTPGDRAVHLVGEPVLASNRLNLEYLLHILLNHRGFVCQRSVLLLQAFAGDERLGGIPKHILELQVYGLITRTRVFKSEPVVARGFPDDIKGSPFPGRDGSDPLHSRFRDNEPHTFLALIAHDFLGRQGGVTNG